MIESSEVKEVGPGTMVGHSQESGDSVNFECSAASAFGRVGSGRGLPLKTKKGSVTLQHSVSQGTIVQ